MIRVKLLDVTANAEKLLFAAGRQCYSEGWVGDSWKVDSEGVVSIIDNKDGHVCTDKEISVLINYLYESGHTSVLEHVKFTFAIDGVSRACYDKDTEVLTKNGWKYFNDVVATDLFATLDKQNCLEFNTCTDIIKYKYDGIIHKYAAQSFDLGVTPNHKLLLKKYDVRVPTSYTLIASEDINFNRFYLNKKIKYVNKNFDNKVIIKGYDYTRNNNAGGTYVKSTGHLVLDKLKFCKLLAWYLSEGSVYYNKKENSYSISVSQSHKNTRKLIFDTVNSLGFTATLDVKGIKFKSLTLGRFFKTLGLSSSKFIPYNLFDFFDKHSAHIFINTYILGDGTIEEKGHKRIYTTSKVLADQLQILCGIAGYSASIWIDDRVGSSHYSKVIGYNVRHTKICYVISLSNGSKNIEPVVKRDKHLSFEKYKDYVYCVTVPNNTLYVRKNGKAVWCGNCSHQHVRHRIASYSQQSQRYVANDGYFTPENFVTPPLISENEEANMLYTDILHYIQEGYNKLKALGIKSEDARYVMPNAAITRFLVSKNCVSLSHFFGLRCCKLAQWEIRDLANQMLTLCKEALPVVFDNAGARCVKAGYCSESKARSCGRYPTKDDVLEGYKLWKESQEVKKDGN